MQETTAVDTPVNLVAFVDEFPGVPVDVLVELIDNQGLSDTLCKWCGLT